MRANVLRDSIELVELTEERLLRFGFEKNAIDIFPKPPKNRDYFSNENIVIIRQDGVFEFRWHNVYPRSITIKYVYELQNLYFVLIGEELEVKE